MLGQAISLGIWCKRVPVESSIILMFMPDCSQKTKLIYAVNIRSLWFNNRCCGCRMHKPLRLIINADDLGVDSQTNQAIFELMTHGLVSSATLLANGPALEDAIKMIPRFPNCSFGVHLNITQYKPLTDWRDFETCLDGKGELVRDRVERELRAEMRRRVMSEWSDQVEKLLGLGVIISHLDSHHHIHTKPVLFRVLKSLQKRYGIRKVRLSKNIYSSSNPPASRSLMLKKKIWNTALRYRYRTNTTQGFTEFDTFHEMAGSGLPDLSTLEVMVHPENPMYKAETELLQSDWVNSMGRAVDIINYDQL